MVFMSVCQQDSPHLVPVFQYICEIRNNKVDTQHVLFRKHEAGINNDNIVIVFHDGHVEADLLNTAEGYYRE